MWTLYLIVGLLLALREIKVMADKLDMGNKFSSYFGMFITTWWFLIPLITLLWPIYLLLELNDWRIGIK